MHLATVLGRSSDVEGVVPPEVSHLVLAVVPQEPHPGLRHVQLLRLGESLHPAPQLNVRSEAVSQVLIQQNGI